MNKKIISILTLVVFVLCQLPVFAAAPTVTITSPTTNDILGSTEVVLSASTSGSEEVRFILDNVEIARFDGEGDFEYVVDKAAYGNHSFKAVAITPGENVRNVTVNFSVKDYSESVVKNLNCNDFDGVSIATAGFSGFQQNIDTTGTPNGKLGLGKGPDGSACVRLQAAKKNDTNLYLPFINFALPSTNKDVYIIDQDIMLSDSNMRYSYEFGGVTNIIMDSAIGGFILEPDTWYNIRAEFDLVKGNLDIYVDGELKLSSSSSNILTKTEVRVLWASRAAEDGYILLDNFVVTRKVATPVVSKMEYLSDGEWTEFASELPLKAEQIKFYVDGNINPASKDTFTLYQNGEAVETEYGFTPDGALWVEPIEELEPKANCVAEYNSGSAGGVISTYFTVGGDDISAMSVTFNSGRYQAQYRSQLTDGSNITTRVIVSNANDVAKDLFVINAVYSGNTMVSCVAAPVTANANGIGIANIPPVNADSGDSIVCYIVDSWEFRTPIAVAGQLIE